MPRMGRSVLASLLFLLPAFLVQEPAARAEVLAYNPYPGAGWESRIGRKLEVPDGGGVTVDLEFNFFDRHFRSARVSEDGYLQFRDAADAIVPWAPATFPTAEPGFGSIAAPFWSSLNPASGGVYFNTLGTRPARTYVLTWLNLAFSENPEFAGSSSFQLALREATGEVEFSYRDVDWDNTWWYAGLNGGDGESGFDVSWDVYQGASLGYRPAGHALAYASATRVRERDRVTLDAGRSYLDGEAISAFRWDFDAENGDTLDATGQRVTTRYAREGVYTARLTVVGSAGTERHDEARITVLGRAPMARIQVVSAPVQYTRALVLSGAPSSDDRGIRSYRWDFGDGSDGAGPWVSHRYLTAGSFLVRLTVEDAAGQTSTATATVRVAPGTRPGTRLHAGGASPGVVYERYPGQGWETVSPALGVSVTSLAEVDGMLYASAWNAVDEGYGSIESAVYRRPLGAAGTDGWEQVGQTFPFLITALQPYRGRLYLGAADSANAVQVYEPETGEWAKAFETVAGVYALKVIDDLLYVGDYNTDNIYRFDGEVFTPVMEVGGSCIWDIENGGGSLFAAAYGNLYYRSDDAGATWFDSRDATQQGDWSRHMWALQSYQGRLYAGLDRGDLMEEGAPAPRAALAVFDEAVDAFVPVVEFDAESAREGVLDLTTDGLCLYLGLGVESKYYNYDLLYTPASGGGGVWEYCGANAVDISPPGGMGQAAGVLLAGPAVDGTPPVVDSFTLSPSVLPQPHHRMVEVRPSFTATDVGGGALTFKLLKIAYHDFGGFDRTCYEGVEGLRCNGPAFRDINVDRQGRIWLRAERDGRGAGRVYTVTGVVLDEAGNASAPVSATVTVPRTPPAPPASTTRSLTTWRPWGSSWR